MDDHIKATQEVEIRRCADSFEYFCETYLKLRHPEDGLSNFKLHEYQKRYIRAIENNQHVIAKKFRQGGFTTLTLAYLLWRSMFKLHQDNAIIVERNRCCNDLQSVFNFFINNLPDWLKPQLEKNNNHIKQFSTGSSLFFLTPEPARGRRLDCVMFDEVAFFDDAEHCWMAVWPCISAGGKSIVVSNPNGTKGNGKWFHDLYSEAERGRNSFHAYRCSYQENPDFSSILWTEQTKNNLTPRAWRQEFLGEFLDPDERTPQEKLDDAVHYLEDITAQEQFIDELHKAGEAARAKKRLDDRDRARYMQSQEAWTITDSEVKEPIMITDSFGPDLYSDSPPKVKDEATKPEVYQFKDMTKEEAARLIDDFMAHSKPVDQAEFDRLTLECSEDFADLWTDLAEIYPEFEHTRNVWVSAVTQKHRDELARESRISDGISPHLLALAGVMSIAEANDRVTTARPDLKILYKVMLSGKFPDSLELAFCEGRLCVNQIPTTILEDDCRDLYNGIFSLKSYQEAVDTVVETIIQKLVPLFGKADTNESLA